ncbi:hypothetical protein WME95_44685 [Sorangium sp. So ce327]|uniref:hypothetical protein n=1 Tax=Sorangium sp. So ce327 TaxID=3133301 RepID=UPI003F616754
MLVSVLASRPGYAQGRDGHDAARPSIFVLGTPSNFASTLIPFLLQDRLTARGGLFEPAPLWQEQVVVADRLVTGQNPVSAAGIAEPMVAILDARANH